MTYPNLKAEMARIGVKIPDIAAAAGTATSTVYGWMNGIGGKPSVDQAFAIQEKYFPDCDMKYLFARK